MKKKKLPDILFKAGLCVLIGGILSGIVLGFVTSGGGFNLSASITAWLLSVVCAGGLTAVSGSLSEVKENKEKDEEILKRIIEQLQTENNESRNSGSGVTGQEGGD